jgi:hypothetical protein
MRIDVAGVGNALVDALVIVEDDLVLQDLGLTRGTMHPVDHDGWMKAYERLRSHKIAFESGGSCANTVSTAGLLGASAIYCGQVGDDQMGRLYASKMQEACGDHALRFTKERATGKCLAIISAVDAERTMLTDLGAATELPGLDDFEAQLENARIVHFEGYGLLGGPIKAAVLRALAVAKASGARISFDAADPFVPMTIPEDVRDVLTRFADIAFLNAEEARILGGGLPPHEAIHAIADACGITTLAVKLGAHGSLVRHNGEVFEIPARKVKAVDTTGAGDAYAGGFLYGVSRGWSAEASGHLASAVAALTVGQIGAVVKDRAALVAVRDEIARDRNLGPAVLASEPT